MIVVRKNPSKATPYKMEHSLLQTKLDDQTIRKALIERLNRSMPAPRAVLEELRVHDGNAIADVVALHTTAHCYEIKGETDSIYRALKQAQYYDIAFKRVTLVTTQNHANTAIKHLPHHWGIIIAHQDKELVKFSYLRRAKDNSGFDKKRALLTLWKSEMLEIANGFNIKKAEKYNRSKLSEILSESLKTDQASIAICDILTSRNIRKEAFYT